MKTLSKNLLYVLILAFAITSIANAQDKPLTPLNFNVKAVYGEGDKGITAEFSWTKNPDGVAPNAFFVYYAYGFTDKASDFKLLLKNVIKSGDNTTDFVVSKPFKNGEFSFFIVSAIMQGDKYLESSPSEIIQLKFEGTEKPYIKIVSKPTTDGFVKLNSEWSYQVKISTNIKTSIKYGFEGTPPDGMTIDETSGLISWKPAVAGEYDIIVKVWSIDNPEISALQKLHLNVKDGDNSGKDKKCAYFYGKVNYDDGTPVNTGSVKAWFQKTDGKESSKYANGVASDGGFLIWVNEGKYFLQADGGTFASEFFENTVSIKDATVFDVKCGDSIEVNFIVTKKEEPKKFNVSGKVTDLASGAPLAATIEFIIVDVLNDKSGEKDKKYSVKTKDDGTYTIQLSNAYKYIAYAMPFDKKSLYYGQYYNGVENALEATKLELTSDITDINFALKSIMNTEKGKLSGKVVDSLGNGLQSNIVAFLVNSAKNKDSKFKFKITATSDETGMFTFENLIYGEYVIQSSPTDKEHIPGYYKEADFTVKSWKDATVVIIDAPDNGSIEIKHKVRNKEKGVAGLKGKIKDKSGIFLSKKDKSQENSGVSGSIVYITDSNGEVIDFTFSNEAGDYSTNEATVGALTIIADKVGYNTAIANITLDYQTLPDAVVDLDLEAQPTDVNEFDYSKMYSIYPIPANDFVGIKSSSEIINKVEIINLIGTVVKSSNIESHDAIVDLSGVSNGYYIIRLTSGNQLRIFNFIVSK